MTREGTRTKKQEGAVLFIAMVLLLMLTMIAVGLTSRTRMVAQMTNATYSHDVALSLVNGAQNELMQDSILALSSADSTPTLPDINGVKSHMVFRMESQCGRTRKATANTLLQCRYSEIVSTMEYGKDKKDSSGKRGALAITIGVEQPVLHGSGDL